MWIFSATSRSSSSRGFTLIELLAVLTIMGVLASIVMANVNAAHVRARDTARLTALDTIQGAVEQYFADNGHYPITNCSTNSGPAYTAYEGGWSTNVVCSSVGGSGSQTLAQALGRYIPAPLQDPSGPIAAGSNAGYVYRSDDGINYCLMAYQTPENMGNFAPALVDPLHGNTIYYVSNPSAAPYC